VNAFYSTPSFYVDQKKLDKTVTWEVRQDDIFPLADNAHHYWSGYFTSRPALKRQVRPTPHTRTALCRCARDQLPSRTDRSLQVRIATNFLQAARQLEVIAKTTKQEVNTSSTKSSPAVGDSWSDSLEGAIGVATHHDGMSGTERQDVSDDYEQVLLSTAL
jgi:alpha-mannosidase